MRKGIVDRFEGKDAVIEFNGQTEDILRSILPFKDFDNLMDILFED
ncbi:hypothetical protein [Paenibacillus sp. FSL R7-0333]